MNGATYRVLVGDALEQLRAMPDESVHCWIVSPPYWSLRNYGVPPRVWGGAPDCPHDWQAQRYRLERHRDDGTSGNLQGTTDGQAETRLGELDCATCATCGAWLGCLGLEPDVDLYVQHLVEIFREARRVLRRDGVLWCNVGDVYSSGGRTSRAPDDKNAGRAMETRPETPAGLKPKDLVGVPWRLALALQADGWWIRQECVWSKPNCQPEAVEDRPTRDHEQVFLLTKAAAYFCDMEAVRQPVTGNSHVRGHGAHKKSGGAGVGVRQNASFSKAVTDLVSSRNLRTTWTIPTAPSGEDHYATFPEALPALCIRMGTSEIGCCRKCGAPVSRVVEKETVGFYRGQIPDERTEPGHGGARRHHRTISERRTIAWELGCGCFAGPPVPCTVGDFFGGTMTTGAAALKLGRHFVGVELNPKDVASGERRLAAIGAAAPDQATPKAKTDAPARPVQLALVGRQEP